GAKNTTEGSEISAGSAYLFVKDEQGDITQKAKLVASDGQANDNFGDSVALSDSYIIVGAPNEDDTNTNAGSVYIFDINGSSTQKIQASSPSSDAYFGSSVAISNEYLVVGAEGANGFGRAYVFKKSGGVFSQIAELEKSSPVFNDLFASSVSISENYIVVGAKQDDTLAPDAGNAYLYKIQSDDSVTFEDEVSPSDGEDSDFFGASVAVSGNYIVVGAYQEDTTASNAGSAYVFGIQSDDTALELVKLQASDASIGDNFGNSVAISADKIVVGAYKKESFIQANGSVYQFDIESDGTITQNAKMQASDAQGDDYFGNSVAISGDYIVVGAEYEDTQAQNAGSAYIFDGEPVDRIYVYNAQDNTTMLDEGVQKDLFSIDAASPNGGLTYSLSGSDMDSFELSGATVLNTNPFDYELPEDSDLDNSYSFSVTLSDAGAKSTELLLSIDIEDKHFLELSKEGASDADIDDRFGESMAMSDEYIVVGAPSEDTTSLNAGALYLFKKNADASFTEVDKVQASDAQADDYFAKSVAISGEYVVVGAPQEDSSATDAGSVYLFKIVADALVQIGKVNASDPEAGDMFGSFVSISENYFVVGAPDKNTSTGSAYLYKIQSDESVTEVTTITADDAQSGDMFASSLAIDGEYIVVGAKNENSLYVDSGAAYVYKIVSATTVLEIAKLKADNVGTSNLFGSSVSISGDYVSVGASHKDSLAQDAGMAYLFVRESDTYDDIRQIASFQASDAHSNDYFGSSLAMDDKQIVVGAFGSLNEGSAYLYNYETNGSVLEVQKFRASVNDANNYFGASLSVDSQNIAIGSFKESIVSTDAGAIYTYEKDLNQTP
ncbi:MAG: FG-GAP repeat protein, partial [Campylobacterota bacterium]|nr:FG-GAP repeat protein [Campylobacterota bacterium]